VARIELWMTVFAGRERRARRRAVERARHDAVAGARRGRPAARAGRDAARGAVLRAAAGALLGFLFWLGWGLIALVGQPWYAIGLFYGGLGWAALVVPALGTLGLHGHGTARALTAHALEWLVTCLAIGLLCALAWHRYA